MSRIIMLIPASTNVGFTSVILGVIRAIEKKGINLSIFKPIAQPKLGDGMLDTNSIICTDFSISSNEPLSMNHVELLLVSNKRNILMEEIISRYHEKNKGAKIVLVEGLIPTNRYQFTTTLNYEIACALNAEIVFVLSLDNDSPDQLKKRIELICSEFGGNENKNIIGVIINKLTTSLDKNGFFYPKTAKALNEFNKVNAVNIDSSLLTKNTPLPILGNIPWSFEFIANYVIDIAHYLGATFIHKGEIQIRRVKYIIVCANNLPNMLEHFRPDSLLITSADRYDVLIAACLAEINGIKISAIILTGGFDIDSRIYHLCKGAFQSGLPILTVQINIWQTVLSLQNFNFEIPVNDFSRIEKLQNYIANYINNTWLESLAISSEHPLHLLSPPAFRYQLTTTARQANKRIILPEGNEPRTIKAASICTERGIAQCVLLGDPKDIQHIAKANGIILKSSIKIINPEIVRENYVSRLIELRKNKGITEIIARKQLEDNVVLGTLMLEQNEVDGLVSGAMHTTANTIRPSLQLIKTAQGNSLVSSVFFMLLPKQVLVYGDCAINPNPTSEQLAEIAIQSADSAAIFGIEPRVAMISYSTGNSGTGSDVEKVRKATLLAKIKRPDLTIDGPLQYDAAIAADVALLKSPNSPVAGKATVFIFPDLNTGNTVYKAVQRSANLNSIGPMLQGMRKPVNDLSRGALVDDIVYTVALTAIQSKQKEN